MSDKQEEKSEQSWLGSPLSEMYSGQGPWCFSVVPLVPSKHHCVLYEMPATLKEPPEPHHYTQPKHWKDDYVRMPYSSHSLFVVKNGKEDVIRPRWDVICEAFSKPINSVEEFEKAISSYNTYTPKFTALQHFFEEVLSEEETEVFFNCLLPNIIKLALDLPSIVPGGIPLLKKSYSQAISFSQLQAASILANAFLCTFIWRKSMAERYPGVNFFRLFSANERPKRQNCVAEKFKCLFHYFTRVTTRNPVGVITFERKYHSKSDIPRWDVVDNNLGATKIHITSTGVIEDAHGFLQVDFANKFVGGGVLKYGCVQEEIRFVICPELIISRLFTEELSENEALIVTGAERYSNYVGYSDSFKWDGNCNDDTPCDLYGRKRTTVAVIDATRFTKSKDQFHCTAIIRELNKAYVGFSCKEKQNLSPVATGNWGCGAFKGDPNLKVLIQLMACSAAGRNMVYYSFGNTELRDEFYNMHLFLSNHQITISQLWKYLSRFCASGLSPDKLFSFIQQCHFDMKSQPTLKQFLCFNVQKRKTEGSLPSTSGSEDELKTKKISPKVVKDSRSAQTHKQMGTSSSSKQYPKLPLTIEQKSTNNSPVDSDKIIQIIDLIDGNKPKSPKGELNENVSMLVEIDKVQNVQNKVDNICGNKEESTEIAMEVDHDDAPLSFLEDKKRKITDYFSKVTTHVNSYL